MILYTLRCAKDHHFEHWFDNSGDYDVKKADGALVCPECGDTDIAKAIMAPKLAKTAPAPAPACPSGPPGGCGGCAFAGQH
jgi:hypothetical protein